MIVGFNMDIDGSWMIVIIILSGNTLEIQVTFKASFYYHHGRKYGSINEAMVLGEPRVLQLSPNAGRKFTFTGSQEDGLNNTGQT